MSTFVAVGNAYQSFARLLQAVTANIDVLPGPVLVQHGHTEFSSSGCKAVRFVSPGDFEVAIRSEVVIMHAGAGSILQCLWAGGLPIVMPRLSRFGEHIDDHQVDLARALDEGGRVKRVDDAQELRRALLWLRARPLALSTMSTGEPRAIGIIGRAIQDAVGATVASAQ